jgi:hypothetical protein
MLTLCLALPQVSCDASLLAQLQQQLADLGTQRGQNGTVELACVDSGSAGRRLATASGPSCAPGPPTAQVSVNVTLPLDAKATQQPGGSSADRVFKAWQALPDAAKSGVCGPASTDVKVLATQASVLRWAHAHMRWRRCVSWV